MDEKSDCPKPELPHKRRWYQYSLRSLLIVMFLFCFLFAWGGYKMREAEKQKEVVAWVREKEGEVHYDYEFNNDGGFIPNAIPPVPDWLRNLIGIDYFCNVEGVSISGLFRISHDYSDINKIDLSDLTPLHKLPMLKIIHFELQWPYKQELRKLQDALPHCEITWYPFMGSDGLLVNVHDSPFPDGLDVLFWCKQYNDWHLRDLDPHTAEP